jgi:hypothetical protein
MNSSKQEFEQSNSGSDVDRRSAPANNEFSQNDFSLIPPPQLSLPKGGGAIRGIDEKFTVNPVTGTGGTSIPIHISSGRQGFGPQLAVTYNSGQGNSPFGLGWDLAPPSITRKTDRGLPKYNDEVESDTYMITGAEDLVPELVESGGDWSRYRADQSYDGVDYQVYRYRPRTEGAFVHIERWVRKSDGDTHWRTLSPDNLLTIYGKDQNSRITAPEDTTKIFKWLLSETRDDKGNAIIYEYKAENGIGLDLSQSHERNRGDADSSIRKNNRYIKRIKYGNQGPFLDDAGLRPFFVPETQIDDAEWLFEVLFDYGEGHLKSEPPTPEGTKIVQVDNEVEDDAPWPVRQDPYSSHRAGFEIRTYRICQRILMFHHFPDELDGVQDYLISSTEFTYDENPVASFLTSVVQAGYIHESDNRFRQEAYPPVEFTYSKVPLQDGLQAEDAEFLEVKEISPEQLENIPAGMSNTGYQWVDLNGEGLTGILIEQGNTWFYKPNLGSGRFGGLETVDPRPSMPSLNTGNAKLLDLSGDGQLDIAMVDGPAPGFFQRTLDEDWANHQPFETLPKIDWKDPNLRMVDLTGDGLADVLITEDSVLTWHPSEAEKGFGQRERVFHSLNEEKGPRVLFAQEGESALLADSRGTGWSILCACAMEKWSIGQIKATAGSARR